MSVSELDPSVELDSSFGAISVIVTAGGGIAGHSIVAIEFFYKNNYHNLVADLVPRRHASVAERAPKSDMIRGVTGGHEIKAQVRVLGSNEQSIKSKIGSDINSKTWKVPVEKLNDAMLQVGLDVSASTDTPGNDGYANSPYRYAFLGQPSCDSPEQWGFEHGLNCGNWIRRILELAGIQDRTALRYDIPRFQANPGWRQWFIGFISSVTGQTSARL